jgi:molybdopterin molybdotransferase
MMPPIPIDQARDILLDGYAPLGTERVTLAESNRRIVAEPVIARHDQPSANLSAMDGYAARSADVREGARLQVIGEAPAGAPFSGTLGPGECVRIATGGVVPEGADRVVMQEKVSREGDDTIIIANAAGPSFVRPAGMDFAAGERLIASGIANGAAQIGLAAAAGHSELTVFRRPRVAVLAGGDELREPGDELGPGTTYNSAAYAVAALAEGWGGKAIRAPILPDDLDRCIAAIEAMADEVDVFVPLGGASVGDRDLFRPAFDALGAELRFWRIAVVPGKPSWHARMADGRAVLGLPGNPSSAFVCAHLLLKPLLFALTGRDPAPRLGHARLAAPLAANGEREAWLRASVGISGDGVLAANVDARQDSGLQTPLAAANALVRRLPGAEAAPAGALVEFLSLNDGKAVGL